MPLADVFTLHGRRSASSDPADERAFFLDVLAEYQWARDAAGLMPGTIDKLVKPVIELCDHYATVPWRIEPKHLDRYFAGVGKRARSTVRAKITNIDGFYAFLEQRYAGEISRLFGAAVESPVDPFNGPRQREAFLFQQGRELLWWYVEEVRGMFRDDPEHPLAPLFPSERMPGAVAALNMPISPALVPATFRRALKAASRLHLPGPVAELYPHLLRHACATHNYERGMTLWEVQRLLGHEWTTTTVRYLATAQADPEQACREAAGRAVRRLVSDAGSLR
ncbi:site-specific integrase [Streptomyces collinus]|uniref:site-specific integrase n=1 Tax=Streptomyces collinus TaxID=42684 RepID=UPI00331A2015